MCTLAVIFDFSIFLIKGYIIYNISQSGLFPESSLDLNPSTDVMELMMGGVVSVLEGVGLLSVLRAPVMMCWNLLCGGAAVTGARMVLNSIASSEPTQ